MKTVSLSCASDLMDFAPSQEAQERGFAKDQLHGAVAIHNILARNRFAYLADEVGMGKTYVALGVMALFRHFHPESRVMVIAPRENIQQKWMKEYSNFVHSNWKVTDNRVKSIQGTPARRHSFCPSLHALARSLTRNTEWDLFLRMTSFSPPLRAPKGRKRARDRLREAMPRVSKALLPIREGTDSYESFRDNYGRVLNQLLPPVDLLIVDEGHNLKHGFRGAALRNRLVALMFGRKLETDDGRFPEYAPKVRHLLLLSATPFECDYRDLYNQLDIFGFGQAPIKAADGADGVSVRTLIDPEVEEEDKRKLVEQFLVRRISALRIGGQRHTKNMYRREWRQGGYASHDDPMSISDPSQRLVVALMQKKVAEILASEKFNNHFQIGMLSSFESFVESATGRRPSLDADEDDPDETERVFDGDQDATSGERLGADSDSIARVVRSHKRKFDRPLPHPKLDTTAAALTPAFETGDKALVFVRRIATMGELASRLNLAYDRWLEAFMRQRLPNLQAELEDRFRDYREALRSRAKAPQSGSAVGDLQPEEERRYGDEEDTGGTDTFFAWFFRGTGPPNVLSGAAFQKNRLNNPSSAFTTLFEDDYVSWLLGRPNDALGALVQALGRSEPEVVQELRQRSFQYYAAKTKRRVGYSRLYVFEAYQAAALAMLDERGGDLGAKAREVHSQRFEYRMASESLPPGFPGPRVAIGATTAITELAKRTELVKALWPEPGSADFAARFREREIRRELLSAMCRLGASYIELYLLAIDTLGGFQLGQAAESDGRPEVELARRFVDRLEEQQRSPGPFCAFQELSGAADAFETIIAGNFPEVRTANLRHLPTVYGRVLQNQVPVATTAGRRVQRLVRQFRMPGYPLVLVSTDILREGEDLHTFCQRVLHYGITWTPSAMEQRTGRVDRIGSLTERRLDGRDQPALPEEKIQVYYPHLQQTVEVLQVERVLARLNKFMRMVHRVGGVTDSHESRIDKSREMIRDRPNIEPIQGELRSAFPVKDAWLRGETGSNAINRLDEGRLLAHWDAVWAHTLDRLDVEDRRDGLSRYRRAGILLQVDDRSATSPEPARRQPFELELRSEDGGDATLLRCVSPVGLVNLTQGATAIRLEELQRELGIPKVCAEWDAKHRSYQVAVMRGMFFHPETTQFDEVVELVRSTALAADRLEEVLRHEDADPTVWLDQQRGGADG